MKEFNDKLVSQLEFTHVVVYLTEDFIHFGFVCYFLIFRFFYCRIFFIIPPEYFAKNLSETWKIMCNLFRLTIGLIFHLC